MITLLIPAAGEGSRFTSAGYTTPKTLVDVLGKPMLQRVLENLRPADEHQVILISRLDFEITDPFLRLTDLNIQITESTQGAVDTILSARDYITDTPLLVANCDQLCDMDINAFMLAGAGHDGSIVTFKSSKSHHSYVNLDDRNIITQIAEKEVISSAAVAGVYYFANGKDFIDHCDFVIDSNARVKNEFYVSSAISKMISSGRQFIAYDAPSFMLGTPEELQLFEVAIRVGKNVL